MRLFAPRNDWNMSSPKSSNWWGMTGGQTSSGIQVSETSALQFSGAFAATRIISETLASLPWSILEQKDARTTEKAIKHPLWQIVHDQPNPEQDVMCWLDQQVAFQVGWGNAYAEIQRNSLHEIVALWPIHPSRIPLKNIVRNGTMPMSFEDITVGEPGELIYFINNDDNSKTPIPASDMFHVPGVLSSNGITGQSIPRWAANSIGAAIAAEGHAGALFKNGAVSNILLKHPKTLSPETAEKIKQQWSKKFAGVHNHYKTFVMEEGMEAQVIDMDPETTQLLESRRFSITEMARWYRLPPHLLADMSGATFSNIESEGLSFVVYSMMPWIIRWEKAAQRQLLTKDEKKRYRFKFNLNGLLRGDQAARGAFYQVLFNLGAASPNDIREYEDLNPIEFGDQYFVQGNNAVPLDKIGQLAQANIDKAKAPPATKPAAPVVPPNTTNSARLSDEEKAWLLDAMVSHERELPKEIADAVSTRLTKDRDAKDQHLVELVVSVVEGAVTENVKSVSEKLDSLAGNTANTLAEQPERCADAVNLRTTEDVRLRELKIESARASLCEGTKLIIQARVADLMRYEIRAAKDAAKKPLAFAAWRDDFYKKFGSNLSAICVSFVPGLKAIGIEADGEAASQAYVNQSITALSGIAELKISDFEQGVETLVSTWEDRPKQLAESLFRNAI